MRRNTIVLAAVIVVALAAAVGQAQPAPTPAAEPQSQAATPPPAAQQQGQVAATPASSPTQGQVAAPPAAPAPQAQAATTQPAAEAALTNADVVKLSTLGLGDEVVIAKINLAKAVDFKLDTDRLVALKEEGVSKDAIAAMLKRTTPSREGGSTAAANLPVPGSVVTLRTKDREVVLAKMGGSVDYQLAGTRTYHEFGGAQSRVRTHDPNPSILLRSEADPRGQYLSRPEDLHE
jgi:hypothetical protein